MELQEHRLKLFNGVMSIDKDEVAEEKQYFKNLINAINLPSFAIYIGSSPIISHAPITSSLIGILSSLM